MKSLALCALVCSLVPLAAYAAATPSPPFPATKDMMPLLDAEAKTHEGTVAEGPLCFTIQAWTRCEYGVHNGDGREIAILLRKNGAWSVLRYSGGRLTAAVLVSKFGVPQSIAVQLLPPNAPQ